ncbi:MAG: hypothetical protein WDM70_05055 [Nitrosomonadales bacterium]
MINDIHFVQGFTPISLGINTSNTTGFTPTGTRSSFRTGTLNDQFAPEHFLAQCAPDETTGTGHQ